jgi:probable rRNA maturation factor
MIVIEFSESNLIAGQPLVEASLIERAANLVLQYAGPPEPESLTVVISDDEQLERLNQQYLGIEAPTDVLSFPDGSLDPDAGEVYLGDVIISYPRACAQASAGGHPVEHELELLVTHGVLHLLGYDHGEPEEKEAMWAIQAKILRLLENPLNPP